QAPSGLAFDGTHVWVTDILANTLTGLNLDGTVFSVLQVGAQPSTPVFDGSNVWVPNYADDSVSVVRAVTGTLVATLTGNGLAAPRAAAFDGERILITSGVSDGLSLWRAA